MLKIFVLLWKKENQGLTHTHTHTYQKLVDDAVAGESGFEKYRSKLTKATFLKDYQNDFAGSSLDLVFLINF